MPQWAYFQQNGKSLQENYNTIVMERQKYFLEKSLEKQVEEQVEEKLDETVYNAL